MNFEDTEDNLSIVIYSVNFTSNLKYLSDDAEGLYQILADAWGIWKDIMNLRMAVNKNHFPQTLTINYTLSKRVKFRKHYRIFTCASGGTLQEFFKILHRTHWRTLEGPFLYKNACCHNDDHFCAQKIDQL